ncbi:G-protein coupled receptor Mth2-like [Cochliomyia hominivorax]
MFSSKYKLVLPIILNLINKIFSEIPNCSFENTINITDKNLSYLENHIEYDISPELISYYEYNILTNGSRIKVPKHKRGCICPDPCINMCSFNITTIYNDEFYSENFIKSVTLENGSSILEDIFSYFNHRFETPCNVEDIYPIDEFSDARDKWIILEDGDLYIPYYKTTRNRQQYCFDWVDYVNENLESEGGAIVPYICPLNNANYVADKYKSWAMLWSVPFFLMTIFMYYLRPELRNDHTKCFVMYLVYLTLTYSLICYIALVPERGEMECITIGYIIYFGTIGFLTWISIVSFDTFIILTSFDWNIKYRHYFKLGLIMPSIATFIILTIQYSEIDDNWKPGIERGNCGVNNTRWSATFYYYIPHILVLVFCLILYIILIRFLIVTNREVGTIASRTKNSHRKRFFLYFRLFVFMGVVWFTEILSYFLNMTSEGKDQITLVPDIFNALHGIFVFISTVINTNNCKFIKERFFCKRHRHDLVQTRTSSDYLE